MKIRQLFTASLYEPKKLAAFRMLPIGKVFQYVFVFVFLSTAVSFIRFLSGDIDLFGASDELIDYAETVGGLLYPMAFALQFVISTFYLFIRVSFFGLVGLGILSVLRKRGEYRHMWRTAAVSVTVPVLLSVTLDILHVPGAVNFPAAAAVHILYLIAAARYYPKKPAARKAAA
ncbi:hypothetical protein NCCP2716_05720 [Sporosarcina sp. NCCP-2716]|uniref:DUF1189 family protein n=1 Tax=Sporosarcina sp. NCCP-2716 TaxID=2943679 RepID=UPI00203CB0D0|nr:DUF1189 family protein [Sporosarcina sp. NCCP-2716]GKV68074.1 hypothetical protein NCCP2716_05720 [Sporosarcina sp. NCCP-2716]